MYIPLSPTCLHSKGHHNSRPVCKKGIDVHCNIHPPSVCQPVICGYVYLSSSPDESLILTFRVKHKTPFSSDLPVRQCLSKGIPAMFVGPLVWVASLPPRRSIPKDGHCHRLLKGKIVTAPMVAKPILYLGRLRNEIWPLIRLE